MNKPAGSTVLSSVEHGTHFCSVGSRTQELELLGSRIYVLLPW